MPGDKAQQRCELLTITIICLDPNLPVQVFLAVVAKCCSWGIVVNLIVIRLLWSFSCTIGGDSYTVEVFQ